MALKKPEPKVEVRRPDFVGRCRQSPGSDFWMTCAAVWSFKDGKPGFSVKFTALPPGGLTEMIIVPPLEETE